MTVGDTNRASMPTREIVFVKYWDKGSTELGATQMSAALRQLGAASRVIDATELNQVRNAVLVFIKRADFLHLLAARRAGNRCVLDVQDQIVFRRWLSHWFLYDGFIFRNQRQREDYSGWNRRAVSRTIYQHWDPRYRPNTAPSDRLRAAYLGTRRSLPRLWGKLEGVTFIDSGDWFAEASRFNAHLSLRQPGREWRYKPNAKIATAAACNAVLLTTPDCSSVELLGEDYPFYIKHADRENCTEMLRYAAGAFGGPAWSQALERLREIREQTTIERTAGRYLDMFEDLD